MHGDGMLTIWFLCGGKPWYQYITSADPWAPPLVGRRNALLLWLSSMHNIIKLKGKFHYQRTSGSGFLKIFKESKGIYERLSKGLVVRIRVSSLIAPLSFLRTKVLGQNQFFDF
jgi:hypothetical protein